MQPEGRGFKAPGKASGWARHARWKVRGKPGVFPSNTDVKLAKSPSPVWVVVASHGAEGWLSAGRTVFATDPGVKKVWEVGVAVSLISRNSVSLGRSC